MRKLHTIWFVVFLITAISVRSNRSNTSWLQITIIECIWCTAIEVIQKHTLFEYCFFFLHKTNNLKHFDSRLYRGSKYRHTVYIVISKGSRLLANKLFCRSVHGQRHPVFGPDTNSESQFLVGSDYVFEAMIWCFLKYRIKAGKI